MLFRLFTFRSQSSAWCLLRYASFQVFHLPQLLMLSCSQWWFWGFSLAFSEGANAYIGDLKHFALRGVEGQPSIGSARIPSLVFCIYQCMFAAITYVFLGMI